MGYFLLPIRAFFHSHAGRSLVAFWPVIASPMERPKVFISGSFGSGLKYHKALSLFQPVHLPHSTEPVWAFRLCTHSKPPPEWRGQSVGCPRLSLQQLHMAIFAPPFQGVRLLSHHCQRNTLPGARRPAARHVAEGGGGVALIVRPSPFHLQN